MQCIQAEEKVRDEFRDVIRSLIKEDKSEIMVSVNNLNNMIANTLVIGFLVAGVIANDRSFYINGVVAWICIELRGLAAVAGTGSVVISYALSNACSTIRRQNWGTADPAGPSME